MRSLFFVCVLCLFGSGNVKAQSWLGFHAVLTPLFTVNSEVHSGFGVRFASALIQTQGSRVTLELGAEHSLFLVLPQPYFSLFGLFTLDLRLQETNWLSNGLGFSITSSQAAPLGLKFNLLYEIKNLFYLNKNTNSEGIIFIFIRAGLTLFNNTTSTNSLFFEWGVGLYVFRF
jgi:hypothetical protein